MKLASAKWLIAIAVPAVAVYGFAFLQQQQTPALPREFTLLTAMHFQSGSGGPARIVERRTLAVRGTERVELTERFVERVAAPVFSLKRMSLANGRLVLERPLLSVSHTMDVPNYQEYLSGRMDPASDCTKTLSGVKQGSYVKVAEGTFEGFRSITFQPAGQPGATFTQVPALGCSEVGNQSDSGRRGKSWNHVESFRKSVDAAFFVPRKEFREVDFLEGERLALAYTGRAQLSAEGLDDAAVEAEVRKALEKFDRQPPPQMQSSYLQHKAKSR